MSGVHEFGRRSRSILQEIRNPDPHILNCTNLTKTVRFQRNSFSQGQSATLDDGFLEYLVDGDAEVSEVY
tara:strand:- start:8 stop:217 length:210 start_codon:yes stop_codon:yes gene_type:complete